jgi:AcrR family transcriptional regulator
MSSAPALRKAGTRGMPRALREQLMLDVAGAVFARGGYHPASMDEIARLADVSKPMLYAYFGSKQGLYIAYIDREGKELLQRLVDADAPSRRPSALLRARITEFLRFVEERRDGWTVLFREVVSSRPLADEVAQLRAQIVAEVRRMLEAEAPVRRGAHSPASEAIAHAIVGAGESLANWWLANRQVTREEVADWYVGIVRAAGATAARR